MTTSLSNPSPDGLYDLEFLLTPSIGRCWKRESVRGNSVAACFDDEAHSAAKTPEINWLRTKTLVRADIGDRDGYTIVQISRDHTSNEFGVVEGATRIPPIPGPVGDEEAAAFEWLANAGGGQPDLEPIPRRQSPLPSPDPWVP